MFNPVFRIRIRVRIWIHVFGPPRSESESTIQRYGSGSGSGFFYHQAKLVRKPLISTVLWLLLNFLSLKNDVNVLSKSNEQKNFLFKLVFCWCLWKSMTEIAGSGSASGSGSISQSMDPRIRIRIHTKMSRIRNTGLIARQWWPCALVRVACAYA